MHEAGRLVVFSGGGTGGHLYPALALASALRRACPDVRATFLGAARGIEARVLPERGEAHLLLPVRGFARGGGVRANLGVPGALLRSLWLTLRWFRVLRPELVVVTGGYAGAPAGMVAAAMGIPLVLQEQNAVPGLTTRLLARRAREVHVAFPEVRERLPERARARVRDTGNPVLPPAPCGRAAAREALGLDPALPTVLVVGGSQGSAALNHAVTGMVRECGPTAPFQLLWSTGPRHRDAVAAELAPEVPAWVHIRGFIDDMPLALEAADLAVSRAGAMATSEFLAWGLPAILVPLPSAAADHQSRNAAALERAGCALHLPEAGLTGRALREGVEAVLADESRRGGMAERARARGRPGAADAVAGALARILGCGAGDGEVAS
ncbi:MAG: UDP-N-acetylglucosamine--N-acetylmuramyl-(pentapeptide) pyrophosphoryl-undecaprenol N-acetylglucosamine transferase [Longimicrobiales bacterium]|nr:UDP-N-acetylglucosamine--N-acetylmuramyl-(pentapeptide) pyrophosphoryl-undecaprenol N-acetylglucosamine transferase [Longimicrobiales bacterium]